ncbi:MAG: hypothetical protein ABFD84_03920 [Candidatus Polarisedimenticolia bacterium]
MKRARPTAAVFAMVVLAAALFGDARGGVAGERHFARIVNGGGWTPPQLGSPVDRGPYRPTLSYPLGVTFTRFRSPRGARLELAQYTSRNDELIVRPASWRADWIKRIEIGGRAVAYTATVTGDGFAVVSWVAWLDEDGDGKFEVLWWCYLPDEFADWLRARSAAAERKN